MAVTLSSRPIRTDFASGNNWNAVKNPVIYKFTSTGHAALVNYRIEVEVFKASDNTSLTGGVKFSFTPDADGISYADISSIVKAYLSADWTEPSALNERESGTSLKVYIKYQELYDGSATSVVDDVASPIHCVFAGLQIAKSGRSNNNFGGNLIEFVDPLAKFLTLFDNPKLWRDYPATLSFIYDSALTSGHYRLRFYDASGAIVGTTQFNALNAASIDAVNRLMLNFLSAVPAGAATALLEVGQKPAEPAGYTTSVSIPDSDFALGLTPQGPWFNDTDSGDSWVDATGYIKVTTATNSKIVKQDTGVSLSNRFLKVVVTGEWDATGTYYVRCFIGANQVGQASPLAGDGIGVPKSFTMYVHTTSLTDDDIIGVELVKQSGTTVEFRLTDIVIQEGQFVPFFEQLSFAAETPCDNPVMLYWKNSLGGDSFWLFEHGQEAGYSYSGSKKAKRMTLFSEHLTLNQWEALNELNTLGEVYKENIIEFTSTVNKSHKRDGAQVYMVDASGNKTGVIVIPTNNVINTKDEVHSIEIEIELPEVI